MNDLFKIEKVKKADFSIKVMSVEKNVIKTMNNHFGLAKYDVKAIIKYKGTCVDVTANSCSLGRYEDFVSEELWEKDDFRPDKKMVSNILDELLDVYVNQEGYSFEELFEEEILHQYASAMVYYAYGEKHHDNLSYKRIEEDFEKLSCILLPEDDHFAVLFGKDRETITIETLRQPFFKKCFDVNTEREVYEYDGVYYNDRLEPIKVKPYGKGIFDLFTSTQYSKSRVVVSYTK